MTPGSDAVGEGIQPAAVVARPPSWHRLVLAWFGLRWDADAVTVHLNPRALGWTGGAIVGAFYLFLYVQVTRSYEHHTPFPAIDEQILYLQAARNFNQHGFLHSGFLQDLSTSGDASGHPFVYNHMPAGPEILVACITRVIGERYRMLRIACALVFVAGIACFLLFARDLLRHHSLGGAGLPIVFIAPFTVMCLAGHPMYCAFPLLVFFPLVALTRYYASGRIPWLAAALAAVLVSSMFLAYQFVIMTMVSWLGLRVLKLIRIERRHVLAFFIATVVGVLAHVVQNVLWLGPALAIEDIRVTIMNRVTGHPTGEELAGFYQTMNVVHHGTHRLNVGGLWSSLGRSLEVPGLVGLTAMALLLVVFRAWRVARYDRETQEVWFPREHGMPSQVPVMLLLRLGAWIAATVWTPLLIFPAYSADYDLQGVGQFFVAIGAAAVVVAGWRWFRMLFAQTSAGSTAAVASVVLLVFEVSLLATAAAASVSDAYQKHSKSARTALRYGSSRTYESLPRLTQLVGGKVVMTNIYPAVVGFFTREAVIGGAEFDCFPIDAPPRPELAWAKHVRDFGPHVRPTHYILFRSLHTGFTRSRDAESLIQLHARVAARHKIIYDDELYTVFELVY